MEEELEEVKVEHHIGCLETEWCPGGFIEMLASENTPDEFICPSCGRKAQQISMRVIDDEINF